MGCPPNELTNHERLIQLPSPRPGSDLNNIDMLVARNQILLANVPECISATLS
jgi:hypothetical protein